MRLIQLLVFSVGMLPALALALGLGKIQSESALNEPFSGRINLIAPTVQELDSLKVRLAGPEAYERAGIPRSRLLTQLHFSIKQPESGPDYIRITTDDPVREPFLNFLIEVSWSNGRLYREYTVLLDPPVYATTQTREKLAEPATRGTISGPDDEVQAIEDNNVVYNPEYKPSRTTAPSPGPTPPTGRSIDYSGGDYGPVVAGDTLWSIASAMRPDSSVSTQQMMLALLRANPEAFINNNINGLKRGQVLQMPDLSEVRSVNKEDAFAEARMQNNLWEEARGALATTVTTRPESTAAPAPDTPQTETEPATEPAAAAPSAEEEEAELRLVAPTDEGAAGEQEGVAESEAMAQELALANESLEALKLENTELRDKLSETEAIIDDLNRLIVLKESELAELQQQIATAQMEKEKAEAAAREAAADEPEPAAPETQPAAPEETPAAPAEPPATAADDVAETDAMSDEPAGEEAPPAGDTGITSLIPSSLTDIVSGLIDTVKNNLLYVAAGVIALLLLIVGGIFVKRRREGEATEISQSAFPDFDEADEHVGAEDITDMNPDLDQADEETLMPGSDDETIAPEFSREDDKTQIVSPEAETEARSAPTAEAAPGEEEADPLAEVNVFLAYEHFDQAEEFVKDAIEKQPDNLEFHTKLLEVYYAASNKKGYEEAAKVLHDKVNGEGDYWNMAVAMWQEMSPNRELFAEPLAGEEEEAPAEEAEGGGVLNIAGEGEGDQGLDLDFGDTDSGQDLDVTSGPASDDDADILDVTAAIDIDDEEEMLDVTAAAEEENAKKGPEEEADTDDDSLDLSFDDLEPAEEDNSFDMSLDTGEEKDQAGDDDSLDFSMDMAEDETVEKSLDDDSLDISLGSDQEEEPAVEDDSLDLSFDVSGDEEPETAEEDNSFDMSLDTGEEEEQPGEDAMDISLDISGTGGGEEEQAEEEGGLDFSMDLESEEPAAEDKSGAEEDSMDLSFNIGSEEEPEAAEEDNSFDISLDTGEEEEQSGEDAMDISLDISGTGGGEEEQAEEEGGLDFSMDLESEEPAAEEKPDVSEDSLDLSFDTGGGEETGTAEEDSGLELSLDSGEEENEQADEDSGLDLSFDTPEADEADDSSDFSLDLDDSQGAEEDAGQGDEIDLLDISSTPDDAADSDKDMLDVSRDAASDDLLDVTKTSNYQPDEDEDLMDVTTSATGAGMDAEELLDKDEFGDQEDEAVDADTGSDLDFNLDEESNGDANSLDFELSPDESEGDADSLDFNIDMEDESEADSESPPEIDMDATMQMPKRGEMEEDMDEEEADGSDQTIMVPRSGDTEEQTEEDEIASQLDLAKAYVELGDTDNAKAILNEVIAIGSDSQRQQAEELLGQL